MHLELLPTDIIAVDLLYVASAVVFVFAGIATFITLGEKDRKASIIAGLITTLAVIGFITGLTTAINLNTNNVSHNRQTLQSQAKDVYGLELSDQQIDGLLDGNTDSDPAYQEFGKVLIDKGSGQVQKVQLVHINNTWLIIDAGTRNELPHD